jgi:16S rRNA (guanine527-N7)-methyltransferase
VSSAGTSPELPALAAALPEPARRRLAALVEMVASDRSAPSSVRDPAQAWRVHVADSLTGLELEPLAAARSIADVGAGAGFPGLVLAAALPEAEVALVEATARKCAFMREAIDRTETENARVVCERAERWAAAEGRESCDAVTARAVGRLSTVAELASPLLVEGGALVVWKGRRDHHEERELEGAGARLAMEPIEIRAVGPYAGSRHRHLHLIRKSGPTPEELPRRPGIAKKRPLSG